MAAQGIAQAALCSGQAPPACRYAVSTVAGTRPRSAISYPFSRAHARTVAVFTRPRPFAPERARPVAGRFRFWAVRAFRDARAVAVDAKGVTLLLVLVLDPVSPAGSADTCRVTS
jgi:hypothetical protein